MKMENELAATSDGTVKKIHFKAGDTIDTGNLVISIA